MKRKGFTLLELIIVIIIIGVLVSLGFAQFTRLAERARAGEAKLILGTLRKAQAANYIENNVYTTALSSLRTIAAPPITADTSYYFTYSCTTDGLCTATRLTSGGKAPQWSGTSGYTINATIAGIFSSSTDGAAFL
jgi:type IV pilus assembly protein PilE